MSWGRMGGGGGLGCVLGGEGHQSPDHMTWDDSQAFLVGDIYSYLGTSSPGAMKALELIRTPFICTSGSSVLIYGVCEWLQELYCLPKFSFLVVIPDQLMLH